MTPELAAELRGGTLLLTASARQARRLGWQYAQHQRGNGMSHWPAPQILSWSAWLQSLWADWARSSDGAPLLLHPAQEITLWRQAILNSAEGAALLQTRAAAAEARRAWRLAHAWRIPVRRGSFQAGPDSAAFFQWASHYQRACHHLNAIDMARLPDSIEHLSLPSRILFYGFVDWTPQQEAVLRMLESRDCSVVKSQALTMPSSSATLRAFSSTEMELRAAADWARLILDRNPHARIAIVTPTPRAILRLLEHNRVPHHASLPPPLARRGVIAAALHLLQTFLQDLTQESLTSILLSPFISGWQEEARHRAAYDASLRARSGRSYGLRQLAPDSCPILRHIVHRLESTPSDLSPSLWAQAFASRLASFGWPGQMLDSVEYQAVQAWSGVLDQMSRLDLVCNQWNAHEALTELRSLVDETPFEIEDRGQPVEVLSPLEAAGSQFDHLWIAGMDETAWPPPDSPNPFLPLPLQMLYKTPGSSPARRLESASLLTSYLLSAAGEVVVSYPQSLGEEIAGPSPLFSHLPLQQTDPVKTPWCLAPAALDSFVDELAPPLLESAVKGGARILEIQAACPFRAWGEFRADAKKLEEPEIGPDPRERGSLLHDVAALVWKKVESHARLMSLTESETGAIIQAAINDADAAKPAAGRFHRRLRDIERGRLRLLLIDLLQIEKQRAPFTVDALEHKRTIELAGLKLDLRLDRVDSLPNGSKILIDYKTNAPKGEPWVGDRPKQPQLPLYAISESAPVAAVAFSQVKSGDVCFKGIGNTPGIAPGIAHSDDFAHVASAWYDTLSKLARDFRDGHAEVDPREDAVCDYCHLHSLCRIHDQP